MKKNDVFKSLITDITGLGMGVAKHEGMTFFVNGAITGDEVTCAITKITKKFGYARLISIDKPSPDRIDAACKISNKCGGCQIQSLDYKKQVELKTNIVYNNLKRIGGFDDTLLSSVMEPTVGMDIPFRYRNKSQFPIGKSKDGDIIYGFYGVHSHRIIPCDDCLIGIEENSSILELVKSFMEKYNIKPYDEIRHDGIIRHVIIRKGFNSGEIMMCLVINADELPHYNKLVEMVEEWNKSYGSAHAKWHNNSDSNGLSKYNSEMKSETDYRRFGDIYSLCININKHRTNVILGDNTMCTWSKGDEYEDAIYDLLNLYNINDNFTFDESSPAKTLKFKISAKSFYQVNSIQMQRLYSIALDYANLTGNEIVWDLYCGIGTIGLSAASMGARKVYGVEIVPDAIEDANNNANLNDIENAEFLLGAAEEVVPSFYQEHKDERCDVIFLDPPRKGSDEACLDTIIEASPRRIVYVSCDSATLARDLKYICENSDYEIKRVRAVDQFCHSMHVETVVSLSKFVPFARTLD